MHEDRSSPQYHWCRHGAQPAVPHAERVQGHVEQTGKVALGETRVAPQLAELVHELLRKSDDREFVRMWRTLARLITLFDLCSPENVLAIEIGEFFRKWCARRDSNSGPPA